MKKIIIFLLLTFVFSSSIRAQEKCYCEPVPGYMENAGKVDWAIGEEEKTVPHGQELFVRMKQAASWNKKERGGCRLRPGMKYVVDRYGNPIRVSICGNDIIPGSTIFHSTQETITMIEKPCNCPDDKISDPNPYFQDNGWKPVPIDNGYSTYRTTALTGNIQNDVRTIPLSTSNQNYGFTSCMDTYKVLYPYEFQQYTLTGRLSAFNTISNGPQRRAVKACFSGKTQVGRNLGWIIPLVVVGATVGADAIEGNGIDGFGLFDNHDENIPTTPEDDYHPGNTD